jgi:hypothetical protein
MQYLYSFLALDIVNERMWDAREARQAAELAAVRRPSFPRRTLAQGLAAVSRGSAAAVRRLDDVVADDLGRALAPGK